MRDLTIGDLPDLTVKQFRDIYDNIVQLDRARVAHIGLLRGAIFGNVAVGLATAAQPRLKAELSEVIATWVTQANAMTEQSDAAFAAILGRIAGEPPSSRAH